jgi:predicted component of type VI protein secretion system
VLNAGKEHIIGRSEQCQVQLKDRTVSGQHAKVTKKGQKWVLEDKSSKQGTWLNLSNTYFELTNRVNAALKLSQGQVIGTSLYRFEVISA